jgi:hypothetical protein
MKIELVTRTTPGGPACSSATSGDWHVDADGNHLQSPRRRRQRPAQQVGLGARPTENEARAIHDRAKHPGQ